MKHILAFLLAARVWSLDIAAIEKSLQAEMSAQGIPGAALVIVENGRPILTKGYGVTSSEQSTAVTPNTLFRLGSTAKLFTALAAVQLSAAGKIDLHAPARQYAPELPAFLAKLTLHQLLTHTAGLTDDAPQDGPHDESALAQNVLSWPPETVMTAPGRVMSYSNLGYVLAGFILQRAASKPFATVVQDAVFRPLGMATATYRPFEAITHPLALPHAPGGKLIRPFPDHAGAWPPGSLFLSAIDAARLLESSIPSAILTAHTPIAGDGRDYGYGIIRDSNRWFHTGARAGYGSRFEIFPESRTAIFLMGNRTGALFSRTAELFRTQAGYRPPQQPPSTKSPATDQTVTGVYLNRGPLRAELIFQDNQLHLKTATRKIAVFALAPDRFFIPGGAQLEYFRILRDTAGNPEFLCAEAWCLKRQ